jgi:hypothetical protein
VGRPDPLRVDARRLPAVVMDSERRGLHDRLVDSVVVRA